jgi:hypothetical protein
LLHTLTGEVLETITSVTEIIKCIIHMVEIQIYKAFAFPFVLYVCACSFIVSKATWKHLKSDHTREYLSFREMPSANENHKWKLEVSHCQILCGVAILLFTKCSMSVIHSAHQIRVQRLSVNLPIRWII